ncbi:MAG: cytochrome c [Planctomycetota bacterium]
MSSRTCALLASLLLLGCPARGTAPTFAPPNTAKEGKKLDGKKLFLATCSACHGQDAKGLPNLGRDLNNNAFVKSKSDADLLAFVKAGRAADDPANLAKVAMPPKAGNPALKDEEIQAIIGYVRTLNP